MHESKDIEGHLLGRSSLNSVRLSFLSNHIETGASSLAKRRFRISNPPGDNETYPITAPSRQRRSPQL